MTGITYLSKKQKKIEIPPELLKNKRQLTSSEIERLEQLRNSAENWENIY